MAGIAAAIKWRAAGLGEVAVYEKADGPGGTWRDNTYPGVSCDVPSHLYSYSFAPNPEWTTTFSPGEEIRDYLEAVAVEFGVADFITYGVEVVELSYGHGRWRVGFVDGRTDEADVVIAATGVLHHPSYPALRDQAWLSASDSCGGLSMPFDAE
jgi:cation diffusion facilitator CzcD-associated flavoprotein CzcO